MAKNKIVVCGGGPAGIMASVRAAQLGQDVTLIEKNSALGRKLLLSGKGRCNLTNDCDLESFLSRFSRNGQFLRDAFKKFFNRELIDFFEQRGLKVKVERQNRVFPVTDKAGSVLEVLIRELLRNKVNIVYNCRVEDVLVHNGLIKGVALSNGSTLYADKVILATGGMSYGATGSTGDGLVLAKRLGHQIVPCRAGLVALEVSGDLPRLLEGLTLKNIRLVFLDGKKELVSEIGELMFTDFGVSGPLVLSLSGRIVDWLAQNKKVYLDIDLKPALSMDQINDRFLREFKLFPKKAVKSIMKGFLPLRLVEVFVDNVKIDPLKLAGQITQNERGAMTSLLKKFRLQILRPRPLKEAMVTQGGISLKEIHPRTMESRLIKGLYFSGEMIDLDADTGGFNLQAAFSTGYLAGESASG